MQNKDKNDDHQNVLKIDKKIRNAPNLLIGNPRIAARKPTEKKKLGHSVAVLNET